MPFFKKSIPPDNDERMHKLEELLGLTYSEKCKFWRIFSKYKHKYPRTTLAVEKFYQFCGIPSNQFSDGIFRLCDCGNDQSLTFSEFVAAVTTYCMFEKSHMYKYCFFAFDMDQNGFIDKNEIRDLQKCLFHKGHKYGNTKKAWAKAIYEADKNKDGQLDFEEFETLLKLNPMMLYPAWQMQTNMMQQIMGETWWRQRRHKLAMDRKKKKKNLEYEEQRIKKLRRKSMRQAKIHQLGFVRYYFGPLVKWFNRKFRPRSGHDIDAFYNTWTKSNGYNPETGLRVDTRAPATGESVTALAREFGLSPVKQVVRSSYAANGIERVVSDANGGTPKIIRWSEEVDRHEEEKTAEQEVEIKTDRSNGLHRSGHWTSGSLNKLSSRGYDREPIVPATPIKESGDGPEMGSNAGPEMGSNAGPEVEADSDEASSSDSGESSSDSEEDREATPDFDDVASPGEKKKKKKTIGMVKMIKRKNAAGKIMRRLLKSRRVPQSSHQIEMSGNY